MSSAGGRAAAMAMQRAAFALWCVLATAIHGLTLTPAAHAQAQDWQQGAGVRVERVPRTNVLGSDIARFGVRGDVFDGCARLCARDRRCQFFVYERFQKVPGETTCYLKSSEKNRVSETCCDAGRVQRLP